MGLEMQTRTGRIHQDMEGQTWYPWLPAEAVPGLQLHIRSNGAIVDSDPPLNCRDTQPGAEELRNRERIPGKQIEGGYPGATACRCHRIREGTRCEAAGKCLRAEAGRKCW